ncbi:MAG TPA: hypothetical protein VGP62_16635 [Bryobacteraceae bacterium]|jgi:hypothetical protein|nr:hypothetical protein [Bryobacteraceae bacterium]
MKRTVCCLLLSVVSLLADVSGKWSGSFDITGPDGETKADTAFLNLKQEGGKITGTAGPNEEKQFEIKTGKIDGDKIALEVVMDDGGVMTFDLALADDHIKGNVKGQMGDETMTAKLDVTRVK